jgi:choice-of-anchor C domain-containing protein
MGETAVKTKLLSIAASLALFATVSPASAGVNLIQNGSFENGSYVDGGSGFDTLIAGDTSLTSWTVGLDSVDWIGSYWQPADGIHSIDLSGNALGSLSQSFSAVIGKQYTVSFMLAGNPDGGPDPKTVEVSVNGTNQFINFPLNGVTKQNMNWTPESFTFIANTTSETLTFVSTTCASSGDNACAFGPALDAVSVTSAVPELSTWGMMLIGFAGLGLIAYRRARRASSIITAA